MIPFLYGDSHRERDGRLPFGELDHGVCGILRDFAALFAVDSGAAAEAMVRLASFDKRVVNKHPCPCGSLRRLERCRNRRVNSLRNQLGQRWFREQFEWLSEKQR